MNLQQIIDTKTAIISTGTTALAGLATEPTQFSNEPATDALIKAIIAVLTGLLSGWLRGMMSKKNRQ